MPEKRTLGFADFTEFATEAMDGCQPYPYQRRLAAEGLPDLLRVPTGAGKTAAAVLPWLWRRMSMPGSIQDRLVYVLPLPALVEQTQRRISGWLERLGLATTVPVVTIAGGEPLDDGDWRLSPHQPAILLGTQDMIVSRLLLRGYGEWRSSWPVTFGLLHCSSQFVLDEAELFGPALSTSLQLQALRDKLGSAGGSATMWMSATADPAELVTPDRGPPARVVTLGAADLADERLAKRLSATRMVRRVSLPSDPARYPVVLAGGLAAWHVRGTATIAILNTAERARAVYDALEETAQSADLLLVHASFRSQERSLTAALMDAHLSAAGRIVVATQAVEAGADVSCQTMFTESAPWSSIVQRAGRCNRGGDEPGAILLWSPPPGCPPAVGPRSAGVPSAGVPSAGAPSAGVPSAGAPSAGVPSAGYPAAAPYDAPSLAAAEDVLAAFEGAEVNPVLLCDRRVAREPADHPVLRQRDLYHLFDTAPCQAADVDAAPWIHDGGDPTALVAWRSWPDGRPAVEEPSPGGAELCPVPLQDLRRSRAAYWICDQAEGRWRGCEPADFRPGAILLTDAAGGGYLPDRGWSPGSTSPVAPVGDHSAAGPDAIDRDHATFTGAWVDLCTHLADAECELRALTGGWPCDGLTKEQLEAAALAARFHDLGKAFRHFQDYLRGSAAGEPPPGGPWAKSPGRGGRHTARPFLRHELVTALALLHPRCRLLDGIAEPDLVAYLAAAHHGKVRMRVAPMPGEAGHDPPRVLGVEDGDELPAVTLPHGAHIPALTLDTRLFSDEPRGAAVPGEGAVGEGAVGEGAVGEGAVGGADGGSWTARTVHLRDRRDLGPFRLAYLEALVRIADWRASRHPSVVTAVPPAS